MNLTETPILLIACGGNSERMGKDKSQLNYHGKPQYLHLSEISKPHFKSIYFSIQKKQLPYFSSIQNVIIDSEMFKGHGPISGLLSCYEINNNRSVIYIGCDYPLLTIDEILNLSSNNDRTSAYFQKYYEPLLAFYTKESLISLEKEFYSENYSLQKFLEKTKAVKIIPQFPERIKSADTREEYNSILYNLNITGLNK